MHLYIVVGAMWGLAIFSLTPVFLGLLGSDARMVLLTILVAAFSVMAGAAVGWAVYVLRLAQKNSPDHEGRHHLNRDGR